MTRREFYGQIAAGFGIDSTAPTPQLLEELRTMLRELRHAGQPAGLIIDEAHELSDELLREVRLLSNFETPAEKLLPIVLIGQSTLAERLNQPAWWPLKQRIALRSVLAPLDLIETAAYINSRIEVAGGRSVEAFTRDAVLAIHEASGGLARTINVLCDNALLSGFAGGERPVGRTIVREVCRDFDLEPAQPAAARAPTDKQPETTAAPAETPSTALISFRTQPFDGSLALGLPAAAPGGTRERSRGITKLATPPRRWRRLGMSYFEDAILRAARRASAPETADGSLAAVVAEAEPVLDSPWNFVDARPRPDVQLEPPLSVQAEPDLSGRIEPGVASRLVGPSTTHEGWVEQYRKLAATLYHTKLDRGLKTLLVTSALPNEGKTLTTTNLALTFSESYRQRVLLIDADLRRPSIRKMFGLPGDSGINDVLQPDAQTQPLVFQVSKHLSVLPAGRANADPMSALTSDRMRELVVQAAATFDWVIIDTPPVALLPDANLLAAMADGALFVVRSGLTPHISIQRAIAALGRDHILGIVLNRVHKKFLTAGYGYYGYYYYSGYRYYGAKKSE